MASGKLPVFTVKNFKKAPASDPDFYIKTFQEHKAEHPFIMEPHRHDFFMIMLFTKGKGVHTIDFNTYDIKPGSVFFMSPGEMHSWKLSNDTDGYVLFFNRSFFIMNAPNRNMNELQFFSIENKVQHSLFNRSQTKITEELLKNIYNESKTEAKQQTLILRAYLDILLLKFAAIIEPERSVKRSKTIELITRLEQLIEVNYKAHLTVTYYAKELAISPVQLTSLTTAYLNKSVAELIHDRLILEAKRLLIYTDLTVSEISNELNFSDNSYFNKFFKKASGQTPEQFRKRFFNTANT